MSSPIHTIAIAVLIVGIVVVAVGIEVVFAIERARRQSSENIFDDDAQGDWPAIPSVSPPPFHEAEIVRE
jgi:hypothetical protein